MFLVADQAFMVLNVYFMRNLSSAELSVRELSTAFSISSITGKLFLTAYH